MAAPRGVRYAGAARGRRRKMRQVSLGGGAESRGGSVAVTLHTCSGSKMPPFAHAATYDLDVIAWGRDAAVRGVREMAMGEIACLYLLVDTKGRRAYVGETGAAAGQIAQHCRRGSGNEDSFKFDMVAIVWDGRPVRTTRLNDVSVRKALGAALIEAIAEDGRLLPVNSSVGGARAGLVQAPLIRMLANVMRSIPHLVECLESPSGWNIRSHVGKLLQALSGTLSAWRPISTAIRAIIVTIDGSALQELFDMVTEAAGMGGKETVNLPALIGHWGRRWRAPRNKRGDRGGTAVNSAATSRRRRGWQVTIRGDLLGTIVGSGSNLHMMPKGTGGRLRLRLLGNGADCTIDIRIDDCRGPVELGRRSGTGAGISAAGSGEVEPSPPAPCQKIDKADIRGARMAPTAIAAGRIRQPRPRRAKSAAPAPAPRPLGIPRDADKGIPLLQVRDEHHTFDDLIVAGDTMARLERIVKENKAFEALLHYGLRPTNRILLCGPPGTGKTLTARVLAAAMGYRLVHVVFYSLVSPYLGETASNLRRVFEFAGSGRFVVMFDEFDIVGKRRDDPHEHGEIKRLVNNFMQMMDDFKGRSIILAATNHQHLLDRALWRRFDEVVYYDNPDQGRRERLLEMYLGALRKAGRMPYEELAAMADGFSAADVAKASEDALRDAVVGGRNTVDEAGVRRAIEEHRRRMAAAAAAGG